MVKPPKVLFIYWALEKNRQPNIQFDGFLKSKILCSLQNLNSQFEVTNSVNYTMETPKILSCMGN